MKGKVKMGFKPPRKASVLSSGKAAKMSSYTSRQFRWMAINHWKKAKQLSSIL